MLSIATHHQCFISIFKNRYAGKHLFSVISKINDKIGFTASPGFACSRSIRASAVCAQQNDKPGHACVHKNLTDVRNG